MTKPFSVYGVALQIPEDWRIEFSPKANRDRGDVAFHSPANNVFFVSWGKLENAQRSSKSLEHQRDESIKRVRRNPNVKMAEVERTSNAQLAGHEAIVSKVIAQRRRGIVNRYQEPPHEIWMVHFHCPQSSRYYIAYWNISDDKEYPETEAEFMETINTLVCHQ